MGSSVIHSHKRKKREEMSQEKAQAVEALFNIAPRMLRCVGCGVAKKETGLTFNQIRAINFLAEEKKYLGDIARDRSVSPASASSLIDSLEQDGLVKRENDPMDGRRILVGLTEQGRSCYEEMRVMSYEVLTDLVDNLTDDEAAALAQLLNKM